MNRLPLIALLAAVGCAGPMEGTSIGNPTEMTIRVASSTDVTLSQALFSLTEVTLYYEDDTEETTPIGDTLDTTVGATIEVSGGVWVGMVLVTAGPMVMSGTTRFDDPAHLTLDVPDIWLRPVGETVQFEDGVFVLELASPGWLDAGNAGYDVDSEILVDPDTAVIHDRLVAAVTGGTSLFGDDGDREVSDGEREDGGEADGERDI